MQDFSGPLVSDNLEEPVMELNIIRALTIKRGSCFLCKTHYLCLSLKFPRCFVFCWVFFNICRKSLQSSLTLLGKPQLCCAEFGLCCLFNCCFKGSFNSSLIPGHSFVFEQGLNLEVKASRLWLQLLVSENSDTGL